ncbi:XRE family transcriptional regulator [Rhizobium sp. LjRoot98]|uniref:helix-turn-helix domain-containing protein n=1 Tax=Rhizobium sp. LjRoot98 TaxID=3342345 RepID=UPI003ECF3966
MITGSQCRAARALVEISRQLLATLSGIDEDTIARFERKLETPAVETIATLQTTLEKAGAIFIPEGERGLGVQLKFTRSEARRLSILESQGGLVANDEVPGV